ncbi:MAG: CDP-diacylglycerol--serine O-phosphatidyltransferase [candidate division Zixibacteria bacterium]|nr:CDP-diacylglycerol--serine O-phosphatidyltransferase [candidate division Zixibacteria bacterium]
MANYRPIFPGVFTVGSIFCGFLSIISAAEGDPNTAAWLILLAAFLDGLDGKVARLSGGVSDLGKELDSLADFLSFGIAPAFLVYTFKLNAFGKWGWIIGLVYITASGYRLARYNLLATSEEKGNFLGLPVPVAAVTLAGYVLFCYEVWGSLEYHEYLISFMLIFAGLMVSQVEYDAIPDSFNTRENRIKLLYIVALALAVIFKPRLLIFPLFVLYIGSGLFREAKRIIKTAAGNSGNGV